MHAVPGAECSHRSRLVTILHSSILSTSPIFLSRKPRASVYISVLFSLSTIVLFSERTESLLLPLPSSLGRPLAMVMVAMFLSSLWFLFYLVLNVVIVVSVRITLLSIAQSHLFSSLFVSDGIAAMIFAVFVSSVFISASFSSQRISSCKNNKHVRLQNLSCYFLNT